MGRKHTPETKAKLREIQKNMWDTPARKRMSDLKKKHYQDNPDKLAELVANNKSRSSPRLRYWELPDYSKKAAAAQREKLVAERAA